MPDATPAPVASPAAAPPPRAPAAEPKHEILSDPMGDLSEWRAMEKAARTAGQSSEVFQDGEVGVDGEGAAEAPADGEAPNAADGAAAAPVVDPKTPSEPDQTKPVPHETWKEFMRREADYKKDRAKLAEKRAAVEATEAKFKDRETTVATREAQLVEAMQAAHLVDSRDPYDRWQAVNKLHGLTPAQEREALNEIVRRTLAGGQRTPEQIATEAKTEAVTEADKRIAALEARLAADEKKRTDDATAAEQRRTYAANVAAAELDVATEAKTAIDAGKYKFLKRFSPEQLGKMVVGAMLQEQARCRQTGETFVPIPLDKSFETIEGNIKREYEALTGIVSPAPPNGVATANGSAPATSGGSNAGTQRANGSPQRSPSTVTSVLAAARSGDTGSASDADDWEAIKRAERQKRRAAQ